MSTPTNEYRRTNIRRPRDIYQGLDARLFALAGWLARGPGNVGLMLAKAEQIDKEAPAWASLTDGVLKSRLFDLKEQFRRRPDRSEGLVPKALAALREAAERHLGMRPYTVQLAGSLALYEGYLVEMATGEGKTITASLAAVIRGWAGLPCHIITVNDYLAERDARWMAPLYRFSGLSVGCVTGPMGRDARRDAYRMDVTYTTNKEIVADFLRDRLWLGNLQNAGRRQISALLGRQAEIEKGLVMRGIHYAIVDEADSILIDEAVTPLVISHSLPNDLFLEACEIAHAVSAGLERNADYTVDERRKEIELAPRLSDRLGKLVEQSGARYRGLGGYMDLVEQALTAREFFHRDHQYVIQDGKVVIVDEFTGRQMPQRTWRFGLHQLIEAQENLPLTPPTETLARLSFQRFYRFFHRLAGMTGTAREVADEMWTIYELPTITLPENRPSRRQLFPSRAYADSQSKWRAVIDEVQMLHREDRPVLVGTRSVKDSESLSRRLDALRLPHRLLNAVRHREEAGIVSLAGAPGAVTIATNMAGRGTDIRLGNGVAGRGGLHVIVAECNESSRIDRQLFGRAARQGDPGSARLYMSLEDEVVRRFIPRPARLLIGAQLRGRLPGAGLQATGAARLAQALAQRLAAARRRSVLRMDTWLDDSLSFARRDIV